MTKDCVQSSMVSRLRRCFHLYKTSVQFEVYASALMDDYEEKKDSALSSAGTRRFCLWVLCRQCRRSRRRKE